MIRVQSDLIDIEKELTAFRKSRSGFGALSSFAGYVRDERGQVNQLRLEHYPGFTEKVISEFVSNARRRFEIDDTLIIHRVGEMKPDDAIVLVAAIAQHRKPAIAAVDYLMDFLKTNAPFWKAEAQHGMPRWIEPKHADYQSTAHWTSKE